MPLILYVSDSLFFATSKSKRVLMGTKVDGEVHGEGQRKRKSAEGPKTKSAHLLRWHYGDRVTMGQFSNSFPKHFSYLCEYAIRFDLSCSYCEYPAIFHCLHCSPSCFDPDSLLLAYLWLGLSWIDCISANKSFSSSKTSSRKPYTSSKQQERYKHSVEITINFSPKQGFSKKYVRRSNLLSGVGASVERCASLSTVGR